MSLLVTGSIGLDTVETPQGRVENVLGGSAIYFALAAAQFVPVRLVGAVGEDFDPRLLDPLRDKPIDLRGIEMRAGSRTFRWHGRYQGAMNEAQTLRTELNVLAEHAAALPPEFSDSRFVFLANTHPALQRDFASKLPQAVLVVCDTMNLWIEQERPALERLLSQVHGLVLNDAEARALSGCAHLVGAGRKILKLGPRFVIIKKGEHGSLLVSDDGLAAIPAYPTENIVDPTGCGDSFAGAVMGYLASQGRWDFPTLKAAMARGAAVASITLESFSIDALACCRPAEIERRLTVLRELCRFD